MRLTRARYVTICQQLLVTAVVLGVGLSAAGVMTLQIVTPGGEIPGATGRSATASDLAPAITISDAFVDKAPVTPRVRAVKVSGIDAEAARDIPGAVTAPDDSAARESAPKRQPRKLAALSEPTPVKGYATVGVTWKSGTELAEDEIAVQVRTRTGGTWSDWTTAEYHDEHGPDAGTAEAARVRPGTDAVVVGDVDEVQVKAETASGQAPADLQLAVVDPGAGQVAQEPAAIDTADLQPSSTTQPAPTGPETTGPATTSAGSTGSGDTVALSAMAIAPKPTIYSRAQWGANEALRDKSSLRYGTIKTGFIHHTVNANSYSASQVPALIRGIYAYHTQSRGWSDIGYNFLVDRFGKIWEGRYGGVARAVVGAHTLGYNEYSFAMSAIGNFDIAAAPQAVLDAYAALFAWKLSLSNIRADATRLYVKDKYFQAINGHRDAGSTACPGRYLYAKLPAIRVAAQAIQNRGATPVDPVNLPILAAPAGLPSPTQAPAAAAAQPSFRMPVRSSVAGDQWPDLVTKDSAGAIRVVPTAGIVGFGSRILTSGPWADMSRIVAVGDVTGDGRGDVLARNTSTGVTRVFRGDGRGHVSRPGIAPTKAFRGYDQILGVGDFNRDGRNDVVARHKKTTSLRLFRGAGNGTFQAPVVLKKRWPYQLTAGAARFDAGKAPDLVAMKSGGALYLVPGLGKQNKLAPRVRIGTLPADVNALVAGGDLTGDGVRDLAVRRSDGLTTIHAGTGTARLGQAHGSYPHTAGLVGLTAGQLTGSAAPELVGRDAAGRLVVVPPNGRRNLAPALPGNLTVAGATQVLSVGDWDRNGTADVITRESGGDLLVLRPGLGNGRFGQGRSLGTGWTTVRQLAAVGDVTGDGFPDLLGRISSSNPWTIFPGAGVNAFTAPRVAPASLRTFNQIGSTAWPVSGWVFPSLDRSFVPLAGGDLNGALRTANGAATAGYDFYVGAGDVDGNGVADLLAREKGTGIIWLLPGKASGGFAPRVWVANGFAGYQLIG